MNRGPTEQHLEAEAAEIGLAADSALLVRELWTKAPSLHADKVVADVPPHSAALYRVTPANSA